jgi:glutamine amidotransferase
MSRQKKVAIIDCGISNLGSLSQAIFNLDHNVSIISDPKEIKKSNYLIFPGQGSFNEGMKRIKNRGWFDEIRRSVLEDRTPILGICLGMQLFAKRGSEFGGGEGLNLIDGEVTKISNTNLRIPHVGWNSVSNNPDSLLFAGIRQLTDFYFSHSYVLVTDDNSMVSSTCDYGSPFISSVENRNIFGTQFHPEKSSKAGRLLLENFCNLELC